MFSPTGWTNKNVTLTGKATDLGSGISYYQFSTSENLTSSSSGWISITNTTKEITQTYSVASNDTYYFYVKDATGNVTKKSVIINKIDKVNPTADILISDITTSSAKLNVNADDNNSGIASYKYYLGDTLKSTSTTNNYNFTGLSSGTSYTLKVIVTDNAGNTVEKSIDIATPKSINDLRAGDKVYYDTGNTSVGNQGIIECIVLYDKAYNEENGTNYGIQIVSADTVGENVTLGNSNFNISRNSYNEAILTLNAKAEEYLNTKYATDARCVGSVPDNKNAESKEYYISNYNYMKNYNSTFKNGDTNYEKDYEQMNSNNLNILHLEGKFYWFASRDVNVNSVCTRFLIRSINSAGEFSGSTLCLVEPPNGTPFAYSRTVLGFRPVFTLKSGIKIIEGNGKNIPYTLES